MSAIFGFVEAARAVCRLTAMRTGEVVVISDLASEDRWGTYRLDALAPKFRR